MKTPRRLRLWVIGAGSLLLFTLVMIFVGYLLAPHFYLTRSIFWGESDYKDLEKFPARTIHNAPPTSRFDQLPTDNPYASQIEAIGRDVNNGGSLERYLKSSGTTAFLVIHDDKVLYERYFDGYDETSLQTSFSMAKSFASALVGIATPRSSPRCWDTPRSRRRWTPILTSCRG